MKKLPIVEVIEGANDISRIMKTECKVWHGKEGIVLTFPSLPDNIIINVNKKHVGYQKLHDILHNAPEQIHRKSSKLK